MEREMSLGGPLVGLKVLEIESIGPGPFTAMALADLGANVLRVTRPVHVRTVGRNPVIDRGRTGTLEIDLKSAVGVQRLLRLVGHADALIEGFRPNVMERLGLGPDVCLKQNSRLVYGRVTGWGRTGPLAQTAGHDINYIALSGALHACGTADSGPIPPLNLVGDFGGGGLLLAFGVVCALLEARISGHGQVVDAAMIDGASMLMAMTYGMRATGRWPESRAGNFLDGSAYYYTCYECADGGWMAVGAVEPLFRLQLLGLLGLADDAESIMACENSDPGVRRRLATIFRSRTRDEWQAIFDGTDACATPVLHIDEIMHHKQHVAAGTYTLLDGVIHPDAAPRFGRTKPVHPAKVANGCERARNLSAWGLEAGEIV
jgi:alpha-methylacyl-CoA racemase